MTADSTAEPPVRHWTATVYVVSDGKVILHHHVKTGLWLPPGGHIDEGETPDEAAVREVLEETGLDVRLDAGVNPGYAASVPGGPLSSPAPLAQPIGIQLVEAGPNHQHVDILYRATIESDAPTPTLPEPFLWLSADEAAERGASPDVVAWIRRAIGGG